MSVFWKAFIISAKDGDPIGERNLTIEDDRIRDKDFCRLNLFTIPKINSSHRKIGLLPQNETIVFQPSIFRWELLVSGRVSYTI